MHSLTESRHQKPITKYQRLRVAGNGIIIVFRVETKSSRHLKRFLVVWDLLSIQPMDEDIYSNSIDIIQSDGLFFGFFPWAVQGFVEVFRMVCEEGFVQVVVLFLWADLENNNPVIRGSTASRQIKVFQQACVNRQLT